MPQSVADKIVFITGASAGIGLATARLFAAQGTRLLLAARRHDRLVAEAPSLNVAAGVYTLQLDVTDAAAVQRAVDSLPAQWQNIDILINNAGLSRGLDKLYEGKLQDWDEMIDTNVKGLLYVTRAVVPGMVARGRGHIVNLGSTAGRMTYPNGAVYCATKAAERSITEGLREDLLGTPLRVTTVDPGMVETEFSEVRFRGDKTRAAKVYENVTALTPDDIADAIHYAVTRPPHVNISEILLTPLAQANSLLFHRKSS
ncbi:MAG: 3-hydroxy acid dehydrogenase / malonic semialdehyde reductase [Acidobacteriaceae bacterium]|nr:3-hydroxy acid dehydrogenase / malonic semialdehyde reductase [Acidobacteriaceae bacterium]